MSNTDAVLILADDRAQAVIASAGRISTTEGTAKEIFQRSGDAVKDRKLIRKVVSSGHTSVLEHQTVSIAFENVSVLVEQFMIEHRLASYTVKSRRYVDHSEAGFAVPESIGAESADEYSRGTERLFRFYSFLLKQGIPMEDARFVLPYSFRSNFFMTLNGRELVRLIGEMTEGRGSSLPELRKLGERLKEQVSERLPALADGMPPVRKCAAAEEQMRIEDAHCVKGSAVLIDFTPDAERVLSDAMAFTGRFTPDADGDMLSGENMIALVRDGRPRELESIRAGFTLRGISLAAVTHVTRHRIQSLLVPEVAAAIREGGYIIPDSIRKDPGILAEYDEIFAEQAQLAQRMIDRGISPEELGYLCLAGHTLDLKLWMDGRELLHFLKLRTCNRAQWEIRGVAKQMLALLNEACEPIFWIFGPSCKADGRCPEGKLSCGKPIQ